MSAYSGAKHSLAPKSCLLLVFLLMGLLTEAQIPFQKPTVLNEIKGLPSNRVMVVREDAEGFAWIGTDNGIVRFDGSQLESYFDNKEDSTAINSDYVLDILPDTENGKIWIGTVAGLSAFNPSTKTFKNYRYKADDPNSIPDNRVNRIFKDKHGDIWIGFRDDGLIKYRPGTDDFQRYLCGEQKQTTGESQSPVCPHGVVDIQEDIQNDSILWLGTHIGILRFNKFSGSYEHYVFGEKGIRNSLNSVRCLLPHQDGKIYYGTWWKGVIVFDIASRSFSYLDPCLENGTAAFERDVILGFYPKSKHEFWINSTKVVQLYNSENNCIIKSFSNDEDHSYSVDHIDKQGRIWSASRTHGFLMFNPLMQQYDFRNYEPAKSEFGAYTLTILEDTLRKQLVVSSDAGRGLFLFDPVKDQWQCIPPPDDYPMKRRGGFRSKDISFMDDGSVLIIDENELYWYQDGFEKLKRYPVQPTDAVSRMRSVVKDKEGYYWITAYNNLLRLDVQNQKIYSFEKELKSVSDGLIGGEHLLVDKNDNIWIREHQGLLIYDKAGEKFIYHQHDPSGFPAFRGMRSISADDSGRIWFGTGREYVAYAHADSLESGILRLLGNKEGLIGKSVNLVKPYRDRIMVFTDIGMQLLNPKTLKFEKYLAAEFGLNSLPARATILSNGQVVIGQAKAVVLFHPGKLRGNRESPLPYVSSFRVFDNEWKLNNLPSRPDTIQLSYKQNFFSFDIAAIGYTLSKKTQLRYQLEGFDDGWQDGTRKKFAAYTNVPGGNYRFIVEAFNSEGLRSRERSITYLSISTVWYQRLWFWLAVMALLSGIAYLMYKWRIAQVRKEERLKADFERRLTDVEMSALRAQMNPHFIFNSLNSIEYYIISNEPEKASDYLNRFSRLMRLILQNSKSTIVPLKDDLEALKLYIEMESLRFDNLFDYEVKMESGFNMEGVSVPPMLMQPYVENAIWHGLMQKKGEKGKLDLSLRRNNGHLVCLIEDNGIGRKAAQAIKSKSATQRKSYGMKITSDRLAMLNKLAGANASVRVYDLENTDGSAAGTRVELVIPL